MSTETATALNIKSTTMLSPTDIVVDESRNSRWEPPTEQHINNLAASLEEYGNRISVLVRRVPGDKSVVELVAGYTRHKAAMLIVNGFDYTEESTGTTRRIHMPEFKLKVALVQCNDEEFLDYNRIENERADLSAMDKANIVRLYMEKHGLTHEQVAKKMMVTVPQIYNYKKLLNLPRDIQMQVHTGAIPASAAYAMEALPAEKREAIVAVAKATGKPITVAVAKEAKRDHDNEVAAANPAAKVKKNQRGIKEVRETIADMSVPGNAVPIRNLSKSVVEFLEGTITQKQIDNAFDRVMKDTGVILCEYLKEEHEGTLPDGVKYEVLVRNSIKWDLDRRDD